MGYFWNIEAIQFMKKPYPSLKTLIASLAGHCVIQCVKRMLSLKIVSSKSSHYTVPITADSKSRRDRAGILQ